jgi:adenosylmethionine-8-amino-7-oxononanoate aminotransferase
VNVLKTQAEVLCHSTLLGLSHTAILDLLPPLLAILPPGLERIFFADSGSNAVEAALRIAIEWWYRVGEAQRTKFVSLYGSYHGDTLGAVGVGFVKDFHGHLEHVTVQSLRVPPPHVFRFSQGLSDEAATAAALAALRSLFEKEASSVAALIMEPLAQGASGVWTHSPLYLAGVSALCKEFGVLLIVDEVATGFGKTGRMFAVQSLEDAALQPDLLVMGKGLTGGYLPMSAVATTSKLFSGFLGNTEEYRAFYYGQTFAGNPLAAAVARANIELFTRNNVLARLSARISYLQQLIRDYITPQPHVDEVRSCGVMVGIELTAEAGKRRPYEAQELAAWRVCNRAKELGVFIRPIGNVIVLMPALVMEEGDLERLVSVTARSIEEILGNG